MPNTARALVFDIFGTVVDWRGSIVREGARLAQQPGPEGLAAARIDWPGLADAWRAGYQPALQQVRGGTLPWTDLDVLNRTILDRLLDAHGTPAEAIDRTALNRIWHRLDPWPDIAAGLAALRRQRVVATLSNGHVALLIDLARHGGLVWDTVLSAELFGTYKPERAVYLGAARLLKLDPAEVMMVAAHPSDLRAAAACGLCTAYVHRPLEYGPQGVPEPCEPDEFDFHVDSLVALATALAA